MIKQNVQLLSLSSSPNDKKYDIEIHRKFLLHFSHWARGVRWTLKKARGSTFLCFLNASHTSIIVSFWHIQMTFFKERVRSVLGPSDGHFQMFPQNLKGSLLYQISAQRCRNKGNFLQIFRDYFPLITTQVNDHIWSIMSYGPSLKCPVNYESSRHVE